MDKKCKKCGMVFITKPSKGQLFCKRLCYIGWIKDNLPKTTFKTGDKIGKKHPRWKGGKWLYWRKQVLIRDNYTCQVCKLQEKDIMDVAHLKGYENNGKNRRYNIHNIEHLITFCPNCHRRYDLGKIELQ